MPGPFTYLACPYAHPDPAVSKMRVEAASRAAAFLIAQGELVFSPLSHACAICEVVDLPRGWDYWGEWDKALLTCCSRMKVLMMDGWRESVGVQEEIRIANSLGLWVEYMEPV